MKKGRVNALPRLGYRRGVAHRRDLAFHQGVEQGRFADVGDAYEHDAQGLEVAVVVGGLAVSQFLTLYLTPVIYLDTKKEKGLYVRDRRTATRANGESASAGDAPSLPV